MGVITRLAASNLFYRKTKATVSILAVALGIILVTVLVGLADGTINEHSKRIERIGADIILQPPGSSALFAFNSGVIPIKLKEKILQFPGVRSVSPVLMTAGTKVKDSIVLLWGIDADTYPQVGAGIKIVEGRMFSAPYEVVMDTVWASSKQQEVGDSLMLMNQEFKIVGIRQAGDGGRLLLPIGTLQEIMSAEGKASFFLISAISASAVEPLAAVLRKELPGYNPIFSSTYSQAFRENAIAFKQFVRVVTALAIIVSFLVILLAMYTSVVERTKEIGILKAIGASRLFIVGAILLESVFLCLIGIASGYGLSFLTKAWLLHLYPSLTVDISWHRLWTAGAWAMAGGIVGSLYPAYRASRLDPVETLVFE